MLCKINWFSYFMIIRFTLDIEIGLYVIHKSILICGWNNSIDLCCWLLRLWNCVRWCNGIGTLRIDMMLSITVRPREIYFYVQIISLWIYLDFVTIRACSYSVTSFLLWIEELQSVTQDCLQDAIIYCAKIC